jgi:hypothetical protein
MSSLNMQTSSDYLVANTKLSRGYLYVFVKLNNALKSLHMPSSNNPYTENGFRLKYLLSNGNKLVQLPKFKNQCGTHYLTAGCLAGSVALNHKTWHFSRGQLTVGEGSYGSDRFD